MLSICIPVYNFDVRSLVEKLISQGDQLNIAYELILIDDCSNENFQKINRFEHKNIKQIQLTKNVGRAKIRNLFLEYINFENLLFLDCDSLIVNDLFLKNYIEEINKNEFKVICGGRVYPEICPSRKQRLSWKNGYFKESKTAEERKLVPNKSFMTNNFLIKNDVLEKIKFDERLVLYGHEDTLFGFHLSNDKIEIMHVENPVLNGDIETNENFLKKTEQGIVNLISIYKRIESRDLFAENVSLISYYNKIKQKNLTGIVGFTFNLTKPLLHFLFVNAIVNLKLFNFYKLGIFLKNYKTK
ncbi:MAG: glycosyltransferase [Bacteroidota bacterium]